MSTRPPAPEIRAAAAFRLPARPRSLKRMLWSPMNNSMASAVGEAISMARLPTAAARRKFSELVNRVWYTKQRITLTRYGQPLVAVVPIRNIEKRFLDEVKRVLEKYGALHQDPDQPVVETPAAERIVDIAVREGERVEAGARILTLERTRGDAQQAAAEADVARQREALAAGPVLAQGATSSISGTVVDNTGEPLAGAVVIIRNTQTGDTRQVDSVFPGAEVAPIVESAVMRTTSAPRSRAASAMA